MAEREGFESASKRKFNSLQGTDRTESTAKALGVTVDRLQIDCSRRVRRAEAFSADLVSRQRQPEWRSMLRRGLSTHTIYAWEAKYGGLDASEAQRFRQLEDENHRLKTEEASGRSELGPGGC